MRDAPPAAAESHEDYFRARSEAIEQFALEYFEESEDAAKRAHQLGRVGAAIGYLGLSTLAGLPSVSPDSAEQLALDYGRMLENGFSRESGILELAGAVDPLQS